MTSGSRALLVLSWLTSTSQVGDVISFIADEESGAQRTGSHVPKVQNDRAKRSGFHLGSLASGSSKALSARPHHPVTSQNTRVPALHSLALLSHSQVQARVGRGSGSGLGATGSPERKETGEPPSLQGRTQAFSTSRHPSTASPPIL